MRKILSGDKGSVIIYVTILIAILVGFTAIVVDGGLKYLTKSRLQNAVDAAAISGAYELMKDPTGEEAKEMAALYLINNNVEIPADYKNIIGPESLNVTTFPDTLDDGDDTVTLQVSDWKVLKNPTAYYSKITVTATRTVHLGLGRIFGSDTNDVTARAVAIMGPIIEPVTAVPVVATESMLSAGLHILKAGADKSEFYVIQDPDNDPENDEDNPFTGGEIDTQGWRGWLDLGLSMNEVGEVFKETRIATMGLGLCPYKTGNVSAVEEEVNWRADNDPYIIVPVVRVVRTDPDADPPTRVYDKDDNDVDEAICKYKVDSDWQVYVLGFSGFELEQPGTVGTGQDMVITGHFLDYMEGVGVVGGGAEQDFGLYGVNLVE